jgi:hypothetical protein
MSRFFPESKLSSSTNVVPVRNVYRARGTQGAQASRISPCPILGARKASAAAAKATYPARARVSVGRRLRRHGFQQQILEIEAEIGKRRDSLHFDLVNRAIGLE